MSDGSSAIPPNPLADPAAQAGLSKLTQDLSQSSLSQSLSSSVLSAVQNQISNTVSNIPTTVGGNFEVIQNALKQMGINFNPIPNALDKFSTVTYHIKLSTCSDAAAWSVNSHADWENTPKEVIAESGVTDGFNIRNFDIKNMCSPQERIGIAVQTTWTMTLVEPYGFSLIDRLYTLARQMGVADHLKCAYFIEVWFQGYNEDGTWFKPALYKLFRVIITDMTVDSTTSGSVYSITGLVDGSLGQANEFAIPANNVIIKDITTFGQFWVAFKELVNNQMKNIDYDTIATRIEYDFVIPKSWNNWKFTRTPSDDTRQSGFEISGPADKPTITISRGMDISKILLTVMSMTNEGKDFTLGVNSAGKDSGQSASKSTSEGVVNIPLIQSKVEFIGFSYYYMDYTRKVTYYFSPYPSVRGYVDRPFIDNSQKTNVQKTRLQTFVSEARLSKAYYYQFTGLNTDISKFDIKLDNYWTAIQPLYDGYNTGSNFDLPQYVAGQSVPQTIYNNYKRAKAAVQEAQVNLDTLNKLDKSQQSKNYKDDLKAAQEQLKQAKAALDTYKGINVADFEIGFATGSPGEQSIGGIIVKNKDLLTNEVTRADIASRIAYNITRPKGVQDRYLESVRPQDPKTNPLPIATFVSKQPNVQNNSSGGNQKADPITSDSKSQPKSRGLLASVIDNVTGPQFVEINLEIRGDPYWMGFDNIENLKYLDPNAPRPPPAQGKQSALFGNGECAFLLFFRTGEEPNENSGFVEFNTSSWAFNGLYVVVEVDNHFRDGQFTQTLHAYKDAAMFSVFDGMSPNK